MSRRPRVVLALVVTIALGSAIAAPCASAQTLVPNPACLVGGCNKDDKDDEHRAAASSGCAWAAMLVCSGKTVIDGALNVAGDVATAGAQAMGDAAMGALTSWVAGGAAWLVAKAGELLDRSTRPALGSTWFSRQYRGMVVLAVSLALLALLCAVIQATIRQDLEMLLRSALIALPAAVLLCFAAVTLVETALSVTDWMTGRVLAGFERDAREFFGDLGEVLAPASISGGLLPGFLLFLGALLTAVMSFIVWLELVMREAAIYVAVAFLPLSFAAMVWRRTAHWCRRLVDGLGAIILAKFTIATAIALAGSAMAHGRSGEGGWTTLLAGSAVMLIAALSPWLLLKVIPLAEGTVQAGLQRGMVRGAVSTAPGAATTTMIVRQAMMRHFVSAGGGSLGHGLAVAPPPSPRTPRPEAVPEAAGAPTRVATTARQRNPSRARAAEGERGERGS